MATSESADVENGDDVNSRADANRAAIDNGMALRVQPPAPRPTEFYFVGDSGQWKRQKFGQSTAVTVDVETVRRVVDREIPKNDRVGGGIRAVNKSDKDK